MNFADALISLTSHCTRSKDEIFQTKDHLKNKRNNRPASQQSFFDRLSVQLVLKSFSYLSYSDLSRVAGLNKAVRFCAKDDLLWRPLYSRYFNKNPSTLKKVTKSTKKIFGKKFLKTQRALCEKIRANYNQCRTPMSNYRIHHLNDGRTHLNPPIVEFKKTWCANVSRYLSFQGDFNLVLTEYQGKPESLAETILQTCDSDSYYNEQRQICSLLFLISEQPEFPAVIDFILKSPKTTFQNIWYHALGCEKLLHLIFEKREREAVLMLNENRVSTIIFVLKLSNFEKKQQIIQFLLEKGANKQNIMQFVLENEEEFNAKGLDRATLLFKSMEMNAFDSTIILPIVRTDQERRVKQLKKEVSTFPGVLLDIILNYHGLSDYFQISDPNNSNILHYSMLKKVCHLHKGKVCQLHNGMENLLDEIGVDALFQKNAWGLTPFAMGAYNNRSCFDNFLKKRVSAEFIQKVYADFEEEKVKKLNEASLIKNSAISSEPSREMNPLSETYLPKFYAKTPSPRTQEEPYFVKF